MDQNRYRKIIGGSGGGFSVRLFRAILTLASYPYAAAITFRNFLYDKGYFRSHCAPVPVISIGNITTNINLVCIVIKSNCLRDTIKGVRCCHENQRPPYRTRQPHPWAGVCKVQRPDTIDRHRATSDEGAHRSANLPVSRL